MEILRFVVAALLMVSGFLVFGISTLGIFRLKYILNRVDTSAKGDTLGALLILSGACLITGIGPSLLKLAALLVFIWITSPLSVFMVCRSEIVTNPPPEEEVEIREL